MSNRIHGKLLIIPTLGIDEQTKINHVGCPAGTDTRQRLYVKRTGTASYIGHCFNCGGSGYSFDGSGHGLSRAAEVSANRRSPILRATNFGTDLLLSKPTDTYPLHIKSYLNKYHIETEEAIKVLNYKYCRKWDLLVMPFYHDRAMKEASYQYRKFSGQGQRYYTRLRQHHSPYSHFTSAVTRNPPIVLVEDQISAYRILRESRGKFDSIALLGTSMNPEVKQRLIDAEQAVIVWLDNDAAGKASTDKIIKELIPHGLKVISISTSLEEPKSYNKYELEALMYTGIFK